MVKKQEKQKQQLKHRLQEVKQKVKQLLERMLKWMLKWMLKLISGLMRLPERHFCLVSVITVVCFLVTIVFVFIPNHRESTTGNWMIVMQWLSFSIGLIMLILLIAAWWKIHGKEKFTEKYEVMCNAMFVVWMGYLILFLLFLIPGFLWWDVPQCVRVTAAFLCLTQCVMGFIAWLRLGNAEKHEQFCLELWRNWLFYLGAFWIYLLFVIIVQPLLMPEVSDSLAGTWVGLLTFTQAQELVTHKAPDEEQPVVDAQQNVEDAKDEEEADKVPAQESDNAHPPKQARLTDNRHDALSHAKMNRQHRSRRTH